MKKVKEMLVQIITGIQNNFGPSGSSTGKYPMAVFIYNTK